MRGYRIYVGAAARIQVEFTDPDSAEAAAVTEPITFTFTKPDASTVTRVADHVDVGIYRTVLVVDQPGSWAVRAASSGPEPSVTRGTFSVSA